LGYVTALRNNVTGRATSNYGIFHIIGDTFKIISEEVIKASKKGKNLKNRLI